MTLDRYASAKSYKNAVHALSKTTYLNYLLPYFSQCIAELAMQRLNGIANKRSAKRSKSSKSYNPTARRYILPLLVPPLCPLGTNLLEDLYPTTAQAIYHGPDSVQLIPEYLYNQSFELPKINNTRHGLKYMYAYGVSNNNKSDSDKEALPNMVIKT